jgi:hypothetical protein
MASASGTAQISAPIAAWSSSEKPPSQRKQAATMASAGYVTAFRISRLRRSVTTEMASAMPRTARAIFA